MGDDREEVRPHPLEVLHRHGGVGPVAAPDHPLAKARQDVFGGRPPASHAYQAERLELAQERLRNARPQVSASIDEPLLEVGGRRAALDESERRHGER